MAISIIKEHYAQLNPFSNINTEYSMDLSKEVEASIEKLADLSDKLEKLEGSIVYIGSGDDAAYMSLFPAEVKVGVDRWYSVNNDIIHNKLWPFLDNLTKIKNNIRAKILNDSYLRISVFDDKNLERKISDIYLVKSEFNGNTDEFINSIRDNLENLKENPLDNVKMLIIKGIAKNIDYLEMSKILNNGGYMLIGDKYFTDNNLYPLKNSGMEIIDKDLTLPVLRELSGEPYIVKGYVLRKE